ncbi:MAG: rhodanese-like domain-containing protein [Acidobacteriota bacterium]
MSTSKTTTAKEIEKISVDEVNQRLSRGESLYFLDTRSQDAWSKADLKIPEAIRVPPDQVEKHLADIPHNRTIITYCT